MDFLERILGIDWDAGSGSLEVLLFAVPIAGLMYLAWRRASKQRPK
jgi:hypothetical protein